MVPPTDEELRQARLAFYAKDVEQIQGIVQQFLDKSKAMACFIVDKEGHLIARCGQSEVDAETISALVAGSYAATRQIAKLLGEDEFSVLFNQGEKASIQLYLVGERVLMVVVYGKDTTQGMVKLYSEKTVSKLTELFDQISKRKGELQERISGDFTKEADKQLDNLFGG